MVVLLHRAVTSASGFPATSKERQFSSTKKKGEFMMDLYNNQTVKYISISFIYIYIFMSIIWQFVVRTRWKLFVTTSMQAIVVTIGLKIAR
jgi:hypothetical protein